MNLISTIKNWKNPKMVVKSPADVPDINIYRNKEIMFVIVTEDTKIIERCIQTITEQVTKQDKITVLITSPRMVKKMDKQSNNEFSKIIFGTPIDS